IIQIFEIGEHGGLPYLVLELADQGSLANRLDGVPWPAKESATLVNILAGAVNHAHCRNIIHRDLKPGNILLVANGPMTLASDDSNKSSSLSTKHVSLATLVPKIADFGLAKQLGTETGGTLSSGMIGTPSYMAPEQAGGNRQQLGPSADVYGLGAILYELLT